MSRLAASTPARSEEHTSELQSQSNLVCRLLLEKKKKSLAIPMGHRARGRDNDTGRRPVRFTLCGGPACRNWGICAGPRANQRVQPGVFLLLPRSGAD